MLRFIHLSIEGSNERLRTLLTSWINKTPKGWKYDKVRSKEIAKNVSRNLEEWAYFRAPSKFYDALVCIVVDSTSLTIANIISDKYFSLGKERYNEVITAFYDAFMQVESLGPLKVKISKPNQSLDELVNKETANALTIWEALCNHGDGGICHPYDRDRWFDFVITAVRTSSPIDLDILEQWLVEEKHWPTADNEDDDRTERLLLYFEYGKDLIEHYDKKIYQ